jgi:XTP/dITP diphosphohydrolase
MNEILFATNNRHKVEEMRHALNGVVSILGLSEAGIVAELPEPWFTLEENALAKSTALHDLTGKDCFSEDTGLEVEALNGEPGVFSARFAGSNASDADNLALLLQKMKGISQRKARFRTVISLIHSGRNFYFEGICPGSIKETPAGTQGFGYDPVFQPDGSQLTFAAMSLAEKNVFSHRRKAADKLVLFLQQYRQNHTTD